MVVHNRAQCRRRAHDANHTHIHTRTSTQVDNTLVMLNPFIGLFGKWDGMVEIQGLKDALVVKELKRGVHDALVVAGGFEEASLGSYERNRICRQTWPYWVKRALQHGYDLTFMWVYGGTQVRGLRWPRGRCGHWTPRA
jgi:hypothetical protein